ncbi:MAG: c-type cytochrome [Rhodobacteraceae bacterium]|nr:c-type cytochrome [Paracoccaceae bacterium]
MSKFLKLVAMSALTSGFAAGPVLAEKLGLGRAALPDEIVAWDLDVRPNGVGLPVGSGSVEAGEEIFAEKCAVCHGDFAEGVDNWPKLAGGEDTLDREDPVKTVGSYWPYLSTTWDYINRSMPYGNAQSLEHDEVFAIVAYILYSNDLVEENFVLSNENFLEVEMPNAGGFFIDNRNDVELVSFSAEPCMSNCKTTVEITMMAAVLDVTPETETEVAVKVEPVVEPESEVVTLDPVLLAAGEKAFKKCKACHQVGDGAKNKSGPVLNGVVNSAAGMSDGFRYSKPMKAAAADGLIWNEEELAAFLKKPRKYMKGTKMSFAGLRKDGDIEAVITYLKSFP